MTLRICKLRNFTMNVPSFKFFLNRNNLLKKSRIFYFSRVFKSFTKLFSPYNLLLLNTNRGKNTNLSDYLKQIVTRQNGRDFYFIKFLGFVKNIHKCNFHLRPGHVLNWNNVLTKNDTSQQLCNRCWGMYSASFPRTCLLYTSRCV